MKYFIRILGYLRPHLKLAAITAALTVAVSLLAVLAPWPLKILFDSVVGNVPLPRLVRPILEPFRHDPRELIAAVVAGGLLLTIIQNVLAVINSYVQTWLQQGMILNFRSDLFQHAQRLSLAYHDQSRAGNLIYAINFQADAAAGLVMAVQPLAQSAITLLAMFFIAMQINWKLTLLTVSVMPVLYYSVSFYMRNVQGRIWQVKGMEGETLSIIHEAMSMIRVVVAFGREDYEYRRFRAQGEQALNARVRLTVRQTLFSLVVNTTTAIGTAMVLGYGATLVMTRQMTGGQLLIMLTYVGSIYGPLQQISTIIGSLQDRFVSLEMAFKVLDTKPDIRDLPEAVPVERTMGRVTFDNVAFSYPGRAGTLQDISFEAPPGAVIGIVGATGAGKSTLVSLIPRFADPESGRVLLDDTDIRTLTLGSLRRQIAVVLQEPLLFTGSIADNIRYARPDAGIDEVVKAARAANAHDFIVRLPQQYETPLGERGAKISGGERQRIAIARAFLKDAPILILDEPTSSVDSKTEAIILDALEKLMEQRTTFIIAHRLSSIRHADLILVMDHGRIVERGSHEELLAENGLYEQLHHMQTARIRQSRRAMATLAAEPAESGG